MTLTYTPQKPAGLPPDSMDYAVDGEVLTITHRTYAQDGSVLGESVDTFDFSGLPDGELDRDGIVTSLPVQPIVAGEKIGGVLTLTVLDWSV